MTDCRLFNLWAAALALSAYWMLWDTSAVERGENPLWTCPSLPLVAMLDLLLSSLILPRGGREYLNASRKWSF